MKSTAACVLAALFLVGAAVDRARNMIPPEDVGPYQERIKQATAQLPLRIGDWVGEDVPVPQAAVTLLRPNVILSRKYTNFVTGSTANVLLVHCIDARDLMGHYPPVCYPNQGWMLEEAKPREWRVEGIEAGMVGIDYRFRRSRQEAAGVNIRNFMVLPSGKFGRDMDAIRQSASTDQHFYGAAEVQIITGVMMPTEERERVVEDMIELHKSIIASVLAGPHLAPVQAAIADGN